MGIYSVTQFFTNGDYETPRHHVSLEEAVKAFKHYTSSVAVRIGVVERVIITDGGDSIIAEWVKDRGLVWPEELVGKFLPLV